jgi:hypothetical protein
MVSIDYFDNFYKNQQYFEHILRKDQTQVDQGTDGNQSGKFCWLHPQIMYKDQ